MRKRAVDSVRSMHETLYALDGWRSREIALARATIFRASGQWCRTTCAPVGSADMVFFTASVTDLPLGLEPTQCSLTVVTKDEMIS